MASQRRYQGRSRRRRRVIAEINVVPYIDVMLVLLVIFMVTVPLLNQGVEVDLPQATTEPLDADAQTRPLVLEIDRGGRYFLRQLGDPPVLLAADEVLLRATAVLRRDPTTPVLVRADQTVDYGTVVQAMALLQRAGAPRVGLATELPEG